MNFPGEPLQTNKGMDNKPFKQEETYFFERPDGTIFATDEKSAWGIYSGKVQTVGWRHQPTKLIGVSDGSKYAQALQEARDIFKTTQDMDKAQERIKQGHQEELEAARGHIKAPRNFDTINRQGQPENINNLR